MCNAWAFVGSYEVDSATTPPVKLRMMPLTAAMGYADYALRMTQERGGGKVSWFLEKDTLTRGKMVQHQRRGLSAGEALFKALTETSADWREKGIEMNAAASGAKRSLPDGVPEPEAKRPRKGESKGKGKGDSGKFCGAHGVYVPWRLQGMQTVQRREAVP